MLVALASAAGAVTATSLVTVVSSSLVSSFFVQAVAVRAATAMLARRSLRIMRVPLFKVGGARSAGAKPAKRVRTMRSARLHASVNLRDRQSKRAARRGGPSHSKSEYN